jgi:hypothetical protein
MQTFAQYLVQAMVQCVVWIKLDKFEFSFGYKLFFSSKNQDIINSVKNNRLEKNLFLMHDE